MAYLNKTSKYQVFKEVVLWSNLMCLEQLAFWYTFEDYYNILLYPCRWRRVWETIQDTDLLSMKIGKLYSMTMYLNWRLQKRKQKEKQKPKGKSRCYFDSIFLLEFPLYIIWRYCGWLCYTTRVAEHTWKFLNNQ